jgi:hypothetical protein
MDLPKLINVSIDVTQLEKARFKEVIRKGNGPRAGMKAVFADLVLVHTPNSEYGDYILKQQVTKEERAAKKEMPILGNGKAWFPEGQRQQAPAPKPEAQPVNPDDVPF